MNSVLMRFGAYKVGGCTKADTQVTQSKITPDKVNRFDQAIEAKLRDSSYGANMADINTDIKGDTLSIHVEYYEGRLPHIWDGAETEMPIGKKSANQLADKAFEFIEQYLKDAIPGD